MINFQAGKLHQCLKNQEFITALHNGTKSLFYFYAIYEQVYDILCLISNIHNTILGGFLEGFFNNNSNISERVEEYNKSRRLHYQHVMIDDIQKLGNIFSSYQFHSEVSNNGMSVKDMQKMLIDGDLGRLKNLMQDNNDNPQGGDVLVEEFVTRQLETIERIEKYPLYLRKLIADYVDDIRALTPVDQQAFLKSKIQPDKNIVDRKDLFITEFKENFDKKCSRSKPDQIIKRIISKAIKCEHRNLGSLQKIAKGLFSFGKVIGTSLRIYSSNEENQLKQVLELIILVTIYVALYLKKLIKNLILKPIEIFKFILLGFVYGMDKKILPEKHNLDRLLIDLKYPINELMSLFYQNYEHFALGNDKFEYAAGKKCPMQVLEKLITTKTEYFIRKQNKNLDEMLSQLDSKNDYALKADIGRVIPQDNPIVLAISIINALNQWISKLSVTIGSELGRSFCDSVSSASSNQQQGLVS